MKRFKVILVIIWAVFINTRSMAQEQEFSNGQNILDIKSSDTALNTFIPFNQSIIKNEEFRFRKAIRKAKQVNLIMEYRSDNERFIMSRLDYLKMLKRMLNRSESTEVFIKKMQELFPSQNNQFIKNLDLELIYEQGRKLTFNGYLDELKYVYYNPKVPFF